MFSQLAKRSPWALVCGEFSILLTPRTYLIFPPVNILEARSEPAEEIRNGQKIEKKKSYRASLYFLHIVFVFRYCNCRGN